MHLLAHDVERPWHCRSDPVEMLPRTLVRHSAMVHSDMGCPVLFLDLSDGPLKVEGCPVTGGRR